MLKALKASKRKPMFCSRKVWKSFAADRSTLKNPGPRTLPFRAVPKAFGAGTPKAQTPLSTPGVVHGVADGSVPHQLSIVRFLIFNERYWFGREVPSLLELLLGPVIVCGKPVYPASRSEILQPLMASSTPRFTLEKYCWPRPIGNK